MNRPTRALIDLDALRSNYLESRRTHGGRALAVLKANAYGHGAVQCARALEPSADGFAVAFLDEALELRQAGIKAPILLLEGCFSAEELAEAQARACWVVVHHESQLRVIEAFRALRGAPLHAWLKLDSGMRRAGFALARAKETHERLTRAPGVERVTLMTHFARADESDQEATASQIARFDAAVTGLRGDHSLANSAGLLGWPSARREWGRPGILLYGVNPMADESFPLSPVMSLQSEVFAVRPLLPGDALGYGGQFVASAPCRVGLVAIGYADGYPRAVPDGTPVTVGGHVSRVIGRASMDMLTVDLTALHSEGIGSRIELWAKSIPVKRIASAAQTIAYELLCNVKRIPRIYVDTMHPVTA